MTATLDEDAARFEAHRRKLTGLAYRMLGSRAEAEDAVQDAFLRWHAADRASIQNPEAWLSTVVTRLCLDRLKSARAHREIYVGQWLPEPVVDETFEEGPDDLANDISTALMLVLERLSPLERASFILHDVFGLDFAEVARALGRNEAACRQLASRARSHIEKDRPRFTATRQEARQIADAFQAAVEAGDPQGFARLLASDAVLHTDGGGKRAAALNPIFGADKILRFFAGIMRKEAPLMNAAMRPAMINGLPGLVLRESDGSIDTISFEHRQGRITAIYIIRNPDKLRHVTF